MNAKICSKCKQELNVSEFYKNKNNKDGLKGICKKCANKYDNEYNQRTEIKERNKSEEVKKRKHKADFRRRHTDKYREKKCKYIREYQQRPKCKKKKKEYDFEYRNRPKVQQHYKEYRREYCQRSEVKKRIQNLINNLDDRYILNIINRYHGIYLSTASQEQKQIIINIYGSIDNCIEFHRKSIKLGREIKKIIPYGMKRCAFCGEIKDLDKFYKEKTRNDYSSYCKQCYKNILRRENVK